APGRPALPHGKTVAQAHLRDAHDAVIGGRPVSRRRVGRPALLLQTDRPRTPPDSWGSEDACPGERVPVRRRCVGHGARFLEPPRGPPTAARADPCAAPENARPRPAVPGLRPRPNRSPD